MNECEHRLYVEVMLLNFWDVKIDKKPEEWGRKVWRETFWDEICQEAWKEKLLNFLCEIISHEPLQPIIECDPISVLKSTPKRPFNPEE